MNLDGFSIAEWCLALSSISSAEIGTVASDHTRMSFNFNLRFSLNRTGMIDEKPDTVMSQGSASEAHGPTSPAGEDEINLHRCTVRAFDAGLQRLPLGTREGGSACTTPSATPFLLLLRDSRA